MLSPFQKNLLRAALLVLVMLGMLALLISRQKKHVRQQQADREIKATAEIRQRGYDDPRRRSEKPLDFPDYGDGPVYLLTGDCKELSEDLYQVASQASRKVKSLKLKRAGKTLNQPIDLPLLESILTPRDFSQKYLKFRLRELEAYRELTADKADVKAAGEKFLQAYLFRVTGQPDALSNAELVPLAQKVIELKSSDPLLLTYVALVLCEATGDIDVALSTWTRCIEQLRNSRYPLIVQVYLRLFVVDCRSMAGQGQRDALLVSIVRWLEEESATKQWDDCVHFKLVGIWDQNNVTFRNGLLIGCLKSDKVDPFIKHWLTGLYLADKAWDGRGGRYPSNMSRGEYQFFESNLERGKVHLEYACLLRPDSPYPPFKLISAAMTGLDREYEPVDWFRRSVENRFDQSLPYYRLWNSMLPRWGGNLGQFRSFANHCIDTNRFDTQLPYYAFEILLYLQDNEFIDDWSQQEKFGAKVIIDRFLAQRKKYREAHPGEKLYGDTAYYRTRIGYFLERAGYLQLAMAEYKAAEGDLDYSQLQRSHRPGKFLMCRMFAAQGEVQERVLQFDQKIRAGWFADSKMSDVEQLEQEWQELKQTAGDELAERYYAHTGKMLQQLKAYLKGDWVEFDFQDQGLGWEISENEIDWDREDQNLLICRKTNESQSSWARPLISIEAPFHIQAHVEQIAFHTVETRIDIRWTELYGNPNAQEEKVPELNIALSSSWSYPKEKIEQPVPFRSLADLKPYFRIYTVDRVPYRHQEQSIRVMRTGMHLMDWKLRADSSEVTLGNYMDLVRFDETAPLRNHLLFRINAKSKSSRLPGSTGFVWKLKDVRLQRLPATDVLPAADSPLEERITYWEQRVKRDPNDCVARLKLCEVYWEKGLVEELLEQSNQILTRWPELEKIRQYQGLALYKLGRYQEALVSLELAMKEYRDEVDVIMAAAEILAATNDQETRDKKRALQLAEFGKRISDNYKVEFKAMNWANLAVTYAENDNYEAALKANQEAIALAPEVLKPEFQERQKLYEAAKPYRYPQEE